MTIFERENRISRIQKDNLNRNIKSKGKVTSIKTKRIKELRKLQGLTTEEFAEELEISVSMVNALESKKEPLTLDMALKIAKEYNVSLDWLFDISDLQNGEPNNFYIDVRKNIKINIDKDLCYKDENGIMHNEKQPILYLNKILYEFLVKLQQLKDKKTSNDIYLPQKRQLEDIYNEKLENDEEKKVAKFILIPKSKITKEMEDNFNLFPHLYE